jgi:deoxyribonuclease V
MMGWPADATALETLQRELAEALPAPWERGFDPAVAACFVCFGRGRAGPGNAGDPGWAGAAVYRGSHRVAAVAIQGEAGDAYRPGLLALREGPLLEAVVRLVPRPDVLLVNATGRDHPRRAGLALHLGAVLDLPSVGVTNRPLVATGPWPDDGRGATSPLLFEGEVVGAWLRSRPGVRPLAISPGWRVNVDQAVAVVLASCARARTPAPLREARRLARTMRVRTSTRSA